MNLFDHPTQNLHGTLSFDTDSPTAVVAFLSVTLASATRIFESHIGDALIVMICSCLVTVDSEVPITFAWYYNVVL